MSNILIEKVLDRMVSQDDYDEAIEIIALEEGIPFSWILKSYSITEEELELKVANEIHYKYSWFI